MQRQEKVFFDFFKLCKEVDLPFTNDCTGKIKFIHIAGTNGKGSTASYIASSLLEAGYKIGLFTSPHLVSYTERIKINGVEISIKELEELIFKIKTIISEKSESYSKFGEFHLLTVAAFLYFYEKTCDYVVLESGIGGLFDCTNIINPEISVITSIGKDHTEVLGETLEEIAFQKAGIIKPCTPVVISPEIKNSIRDILKKTAKEKESEFFQPISSKENISLFGNSLKYKDVLYKTKMGGAAQISNALCAIAALQVLGISDSFIQKGLEGAFLPSRMQVISKEPLVVLDGAHNPDGLKNSLELFLSSCKEEVIEKSELPVLICGFSKRKDYKTNAYVISSYKNKFSSIYIVINFESAVKVDMSCAKYILLKDIPEIIKKNTNTLITGSLYLSGNTIRYLSKFNL